jgi:succinate dehydrogenase / fumarate reductase cytochrome b subunit
MENHDENKEGIGGMINPRRYGIERVAYLLMRLSGLGLLAYFIGHIYETSSILKGQVGWNEFLALTQTNEGHAILAIVIAMCVFHTVNGIRVMLGHGGVGVGKPARPDYPYSISKCQAQNRYLFSYSFGSNCNDVWFGSNVW